MLEAELRKEGADPAQSLERAERFLLVVGRVSLLAERLQVALLMKTWDADAAQLRGRLELVAGAAEQVRGSAALRAFLGVCLRVGNRLNGNSSHGNAAGFSIGSLDGLTAGLKLASSEDGAPSASLDHLKAQTAPPQQLGGSRWPQQLASARLKAEAVPPPTPRPHLDQVDLRQRDAP